MAIPTYPSHLVSQWRAPDGTIVTIRPIRPEDATIERAFFDALSPEARYLRFMSSIKELTPEMLWQFTHVDYDRDMALIAGSRGSYSRPIAACSPWPQRWAS